LEELQNTTQVQSNGLQEMAVWYGNQQWTAWITPCLKRPFLVVDNARMILRVFRLLQTLDGDTSKNRKTKSKNGRIKKARCKGIKSLSTVFANIRSSYQKICYSTSSWLASWGRRTNSCASWQYLPLAMDVLLGIHVPILPLLDSICIW
jgi:hypothetical protein